MDALKELNSAICIFNELGEILFATNRFRRTFGLKEGSFLLNIKKLLKNVLLKDHPFKSDEIDFNTLIGTELEFQLRLRGDTPKLDVKLLPIRDERDELLGYIWMEQKDF